MPGNFYTVTFDDIAAWPKSNYVDPVQRTWLPGYAIFWCVLSTALVAGRLYLRVRNRSGAFGLDDALIFIAWVFAVAFTAVACVSTWNYGTGRHIWDVRPQNYVGSLYYGWVAQVMFAYSTCACKLSVLLFYRRMAKNSYSKSWLYAVWVLMFITIASWGSMFLVYCFMCTPLSTYWDIYVVEAEGSSYTCLNGDAITIATGVLTIASDFWTAALPCAMFQCHNLGISKRQKIALNIIFCLGFLVTGVGGVRTYYLWKIGHDEDLSWIGYDLFAASIVECQLGIICTCAPFLRALFRRYLPDLTHRSMSITLDSTTGKDDSRISRLPPGWIKAEGSAFRPTNPVRFSEDSEKMLDVSTQERKGVLVHENGSHKVVWNRQSDDSMSNHF